MADDASASALSDAVASGRPVTAATLNAGSNGKLPGLVGVVVDSVEPGELRSHLDLREDHQAPNGFLHAATVIALADTSAGYGCVASLPLGARGFTTIELKSNFLGTAKDGTITCVARLTHGGRTTQVWDAEVRHAGAGAVIALFRCTQMILYPR